MSVGAENTVPPGECTVVLTREFTESASPLSLSSSSSSSTTIIREIRPPGAFGMLIPANDKARNAFNNATIYINEEAGPYLKQFVTVEGSSHDSSEEYSDDSDTDYDTNVGGQSFPESQCLQGYFTLSLDTLPLLARTIGWRIGKGSSKAPHDSRGIDILLVRPGQKEAKKIAAVHALIQFNVDSGALVLTAGSNKPVSYYLENKEIKLPKLSQTALTPTNRFRFGDLEYSITFDVSDIVTFTQRRDNYLKGVHGRDPPHPKLDPIPQPNHERVGHAIIHNSLGFGTFGWVSVGVDSTTGHPLAVKELRIRRNDQTMRLAEDEVALARRFMKKYRGLLKTLQTWCEHGNDGPCGIAPERVYISSALGLRDFDQQDWNDISVSTRLHLFKDTLRGLDTLHKQGLMHRDITIKNLLVVTLSPPEAALCDFGKAIESKDSKDTVIGPKNTLAPEVWGQRPYNNKIDVWSLAYAWIDTFRRRLPRPEHIDSATHCRMFQVIQCLFETGKIKEQFAILLRQMLSWDPLARISADEALHHPCWKDVPDLKQDEEQACIQPHAADIGNTRKRRLYSRQKTVQVVPLQSPSPRHESIDNPAVLTVWKTHQILSEQTPSNSEEISDDYNGADWLRFHAERKRQHQSEQQTNALLLMYS